MLHKELLEACKLFWRILRSVHPAFGRFRPRLMSRTIYGPGPLMLYDPRALILYGPGPLMIWKNFLSQMLQDHIWNAHAPGACCNMLLEHVHFKYSPEAFDLENSFRSLMVQDHITLMVQDHMTLMVLDHMVLDTVSWQSEVSWHDC